MEVIYGEFDGIFSFAVLVIENFFVFCDYERPCPSVRPSIQFFFSNDDIHGFSNDLLINASTSDNDDQVKSHVPPLYWFSLDRWKSS